MSTENYQPRVTIAERLMTTHGRPSGFDYMRLGLAVSIVILHSPVITYGQSADDVLWMSPARPFMRAVMPMFFALSGFLVAGSLERSKTMLSFLGLRVLRIYPALSVEVFLSAFLIGTAVTTFPLAIYFRDPLFLNYLLNVTGDIHYRLPGGFENNPFPNTVNQQLWTVPFELLSYAALTALALLKCVQHKIFIPFAALALALAHLGYRLHKYNWHLLNIVGVFHGALLVVCFWLA